MLEIQNIQILAIASGFRKVNAGPDGTLLLRKAGPDADDPTTHMCIDVVTRSATIYWNENPKIIFSKTFRTCQDMQSWFDQSAQSVACP